MVMVIYMSKTSHEVLLVVQMLSYEEEDMVIFACIRHINAGEFMGGNRSGNYKILDLRISAKKIYLSDMTTFRLVPCKNNVLLIVKMLGLPQSRQMFTFPSDNHPSGFTYPTPFLPVLDRWINWFPSLVESWILTPYQISGARLPYRSKAMLSEDPVGSLGSLTCRFWYLFLFFKRL